MTIYTEKAGAFTGCPDLEQMGHEDDLSLELEQLPRHQSDTLCRVILGGVARQHGQQRRPETCCSMDGRR